MKERPILFSAPMVCAILDGRKTMTRRVVKPQPSKALYLTHSGFISTWHNEKGQPLRNRYGQPGDRLWVRESGLEKDPSHLFKMFAHDASPGRYWVDSDGGRYGASYGPAITRESMIKGGWKVRPSIHMPRWASRITLEVTGVRVERLQNITGADILAEGVRIPADAATGNALLDISTKYGPAHFLGDNWRMVMRDTDALLKAHWAALWVGINGLDSWNANPWVWVVEFKRVEAQKA